MKPFLNLFQICSFKVGHLQLLVPVQVPLTGTCNCQYIVLHPRVLSNYGHSKIQFESISLVKPSIRKFLYYRPFEVIKNLRFRQVKRFLNIQFEMCISKAFSQQLLLVQKLLLVTSPISNNGSQNYPGYTTALFRIGDSQVCSPKVFHQQQLKPYKFSLVLAQVQSCDECLFNYLNLQCLYKRMVTYG